MILGLLFISILVALPTLGVLWPNRANAPLAQPNPLVLPAQPQEVHVPDVYTRLIDAQLRGAIAEAGLTGDPTTGRDLPSIDDPMAQLGKKLFYTKALGGDKDAACATCHVPTLGGGDGLSLSIGVGADDPELLGPGRTHPSGGPTVPRNAPTTFNIAMWDQVLFHDGRVESLGRTRGREGNDGMGIRTPDSAFGTADPTAGANLAIAQARFPVTSVEEMLGEELEQGQPRPVVRTHLAARIGGYGIGLAELDLNDWPDECRTVLPEDGDAPEMISYELIAEALGTYERSQVFVNTPWKAYIEGDDQALSLAAKRGALLFYQSAEQGGADCAACHTGDFFTDEHFYTLAIPQVGPGKGNGPREDDDFGRFRETQDPTDLYAFRTPSLLNVEVTGPWGHSGAYTTLEGTIRHHLNPAAAVDNFDIGQLAPDVQVASMAANTQLAVAQWHTLLKAGLPTVQLIHLTDAQVADLVEFMLALTDPCVKDAACLAPWMPAENDHDPDGLRLELKVAAAN
jgi:cytochrome c peroxidase